MRITPNAEMEHLSKGPLPPPLLQAETWTFLEREGHWITKQVAVVQRWGNVPEIHRAQCQGDLFPGNVSLRDSAMEVPEGALGEASGHGGC